MRDGYNPAATDDPIFFNDRRNGTFIRLDDLLYDRIQAGQVQP